MMEHHRSRSIESPRRQRRDYRRHSRSRSRSPRDRNMRRRSSRSRSRDKMSSSYHRRGGSGEKDLYRDIIHDDYQEDKGHRQNRGRGGGGGVSGAGGGGGADDEERERFWNERSRDKGRDYDRDQRDRDYERGDRDRNRHSRNRRYNSTDRDSDRDNDDSDDSYSGHYYKKTPSNIIIVFGLLSHITEADIMSALIQQNMAPTSIRLLRKRNTGASRGFAFVEFNTVDEAAHWMELTQGTLLLQDQTRASLQYSHSREQFGKSKQNVTDWYCCKCGVFNFKRRDSCFRCYVPREESERKGGEGSEEVSNILTKKIMLRNLDALTNEEAVLTAMQHHAPELATKISKILVSRDSLTQTSLGICYLNFESLVDSMNLHNVLIALEPPLKIDNRDVLINYCIDHENRQIVPKKIGNESGAAAGTVASSSAGLGAGTAAANMLVPSSGQYTLADVPRLAEYSATMYASTPAEHAHFLQYYTDYYIAEINKGQYSNLPTAGQMSEVSANSGAAVALSAIQRKQKKMSSIETTATQAAAAAAAAAAAVKAAMAAQSIVTPKGNDGKTYPTPDVSLYQYDETSGYYYDPTTGLYYDAHSQYYYNNETGAYLYWDQRKNSYVLATPAAVAATVQDVVKQEVGDSEGKASANAPAAEDETKKDKKGESSNKHDKVKVAKKIVKDMEKWAKQLNQKKDYTVVATPQPILPAKGEEVVNPKVQCASTAAGYADVGFSILEKKERAKLTDFMPNNKLVSAYVSDSDDEHNSAPSTSVNSTRPAAGSGESNEKDYVDFQKLTCLLCKRAFQSLDILQKHLKMSNLHKENLQKYNLSRAGGGGGTLNDVDASVNAANAAAALAYRDRAKERRLKYGESDPPPPNRSRERFENEIKSLTSRSQAEAPAMPIGSNNVGNRLLQKMGWSEGQGLGRKNQGRTNIIEADARTSTAGLGAKQSSIGHGDDYKTYIKKMMKSRYESV